jgi:hypothetical protein
LWGGRIERAIVPDDILGKPITRILQTPWEHLEKFDHCDFYIALADGTLFELGQSGLALIDGDSRFAHTLINIEDAAFLSNGFSGVGATIRRVFVYGRERGRESSIYLSLSTGHWLKPDLEEWGCVLLLYDREEFLRGCMGMRVFDYWTREPYTCTESMDKLW